MAELTPLETGRSARAWKFDSSPLRQFVMRNTTIRFKHTESDIRAAAAKSFSVRGTAIALGIRPHGGSLGSLKKRLVNLGVDTSHFTGQRGGGCGHGPLGTIIPASVRLVLRPAGSNREKAHVLRRCLLEIGRQYRCETCGQLPIWNSKPLVLEIEHKNGIVWDDRPENLQFICGHCHSQTPTYKSRNKGKGAGAVYQTRLENESVLAIGALGSNPSPSSNLQAPT